MRLSRFSRAGVGVAALAVSFVMVVGAAWAEAPTKICVPEASSKQVLSTNTKGECPSKTISKALVKYKSEALPGTAELEKLDKLLPHVNYVESGVGGKPTIQFSGVNVQLVNGEGKTASANGEGNLVIGYDEQVIGAEQPQTGSHNLVLGEREGFTSFSGIVAGFQNLISGEFASVLGGQQNLASGRYATVSSGQNNSATGTEASVVGGTGNEASGGSTAVLGGISNKATNSASSAVGGEANLANGARAVVVGGELNTAEGIGSTVGGGFTSVATGELAEANGTGNTASGLKSWVGGGAKNKAEGIASSIFGGKELTAKNSYEAIP